eukprot:359401-Chlamydomonas_euryale.AAC.6
MHSDIALTAEANSLGGAGSGGCGLHLVCTPQQQQYRCAGACACHVPHWKSAAAPAMRHAPHSKHRQHSLVSCHCLASMPLSAALGLTPQTCNTPKLSFG